MLTRGTGSLFAAPVDTEEHRVFAETGCAGGAIAHCCYHIDSPIWQIGAVFLWRLQVNQPISCCNSNNPAAWHQPSNTKLSPRTFPADLFGQNPSPPLMTPKICLLHCIVALFGHPHTANEQPGSCFAVEGTPVRLHSLTTCRKDKTSQ